MNIFLDPSKILEVYGYLGVFVVVFLESGIFFFLPGDSLLFSAGIVASGGVFNIAVLISLIFLATLTGGIVGYLIGVYIDKLRAYRFLGRILKQEYVDKAHTFFEKYGRLAIILSRFVPIVRTFTPIAAGVSRMDFKKFNRYNFVSSVIWSTSITLVGYFLGIKVPTIRTHLHYLVILIVLVSLIPVILEWYRGKRNRTT